ncbi:MAG TPA: glycosyltransferase [Gammaproteobacteria bacterium]|nr:glycosyltransferase [Gammaproteobacteria bacterium]
MRLSIIIPALNEGANITATLQPLQTLRRAGHEIIVVDGGSDDDTARQASPLSDNVISSLRGRARQMNTGADAAANDILLFLHADTLLPHNADKLIVRGMNQTGKAWGRFDVCLSGRHPMLRVVERSMNLRSRLSGIATGDQAMFVKRAMFEKVGGFPDIPLMEDIALSHQLKQHSRPLCLSTPLVTSSRRWEQHGIMKTIVLMWHLRLAYYFGADPQQLVKRYYNK